MRPKILGSFFTRISPDCLSVHVSTKWVLKRCCTSTVPQLLTSPPALPRTGHDLACWAAASDHGMGFLGGLWFKPQFHNALAVVF